MSIEDSTVINLTSLPKEILVQIPLSIKSLKSEYELSEFPYDIKKIIIDYLDSVKTINYKNTVLDIKPGVSIFTDCKTITNSHELVIEYIKNYLQILPNNYPFDPLFACKLKYHLQTKDTAVRKILVSNEINQIIKQVSSDLNITIVVKSLSINSATTGADYSDYVIKINLLINETPKTLGIVIKTQK